jgi:hypothetical protein
MVTALGLVWISRPLTPLLLGACAPMTAPISLVNGSPTLTSSARLDCGLSESLN